MYTTEVPDEFRRAINIYYGKPGIATRKEVKNWLERYGCSMDADLSVLLDSEKKKEGQ